MSQIRVFAAACVAVCLLSGGFDIVRAQQASYPATASKTPVAGEASLSQEWDQPPASGVGVAAVAAADVPGADTPADVDASPSHELAADLAAWQLLSPPYSSPTPLPVSGKAMYYNPGVMKTVIESRMRFAHIDPCQECIGYVAMLRYGDLDRKVWLQVDQWRIEGPFHVVDVAATKHVGLLLSREWVIDVDYRTAQRWGFRMPWVTVWEHPPLELLLATDSFPLDWNTCVAPLPAFVRLPHSTSVPPTAIVEPEQLVKKAIDRRQLGSGDFVDAIIGIPEELYVK